MSEETPPTAPEQAETVVLTPAEQLARKKRNRAIALGLVAFIVLIFGVTVLRLASNIAAN